MRVPPGPGVAAHVDQPADTGPLQNLDQLLQRPVPMADRVHGSLVAIRGSSLTWPPACRREAFGDRRPSTRVGRAVPAGILPFGRVPVLLVAIRGSSLTWPPACRRETFGR